MELRHHVAQRGDVELVTLRDVAQRRRDIRDFRHQLSSLTGVEVDDFGGAVPPRHQQQPGVIGVPAQQEPRQREVTDRKCILRKLRVQGEGDFGGGDHRFFSHLIGFVATYFARRAAARWLGTGGPIGLHSPLVGPK